MSTIVIRIEINDVYFDQLAPYANVIGQRVDEYLQPEFAFPMNRILVGLVKYVSCKELDHARLIINCQTSSLRAPDHAYNSILALITMAFDVLKVDERIPSEVRQILIDASKTLNILPPFAMSMMLA